MDGKELKECWHTGKPSFGAWITTTDPSVAAVVCNIGYEWVIIDAEHNPYNPETLREIINTIRMRHVVPIVRVTENNPALIKQTLDWGAEGIVIPLVKTVEEARQAVQACHYPPQGVRGFNPRDASNYSKDLLEYAKTFDERVISMLMLETVEAVQNLDEILAIPKVDSILIGPADLSYSLGYPLQSGRPEVTQAIDFIIERCNQAQIPVGIAIEGTPESFKNWLRKGITFIPLGMDYKWIKIAGSQILEQMQQQIPDSEINSTGRRLGDDLC